MSWIADEAGQLIVGKALTTTDRTFEGFREALANAGEIAGIAYERLLAETEMLIYGTTRSTNSIIEGKVAKTALLTTEGFPDTLPLPPRRQARAAQPRDGVPATLYPPPPDLPRFRSASTPRAASSVSWTKPPHARIIESLPRKRIEAVAVAAALVHREPRPRASHRGADRGDHAGRALHPLPPAQPDHPRIPAHVFHRPRPPRSSP